MYELKIHKEAEKGLKKTQKRIKEKAFMCLIHLKNHGMKDCPFPIEPLQGPYKKYKYFEAKIHKDFRIFFRFEDDSILIRKAGTHNELGTG